MIHHPMNVIAQQLHALALKVEAIEKTQQQPPQQQQPPVDLTQIEGKIRGLEEKIDRVLASRKLTETVVTLKMESEIKRLEEKMKQMVLNHVPIANSLCILPDVAAPAALPVVAAATSDVASPTNVVPDVVAPANAAPAPVDDFEIKLKVKKPPKSSR